MSGYSPGGYIPRPGVVTAREAGLAMKANLSSCAHENRERVIAASGEYVANLCADCLMELPVSWRVEQ